MPARNAGVSSIGEITLTTPSSMPTSMPRPPNLPCVPTCSSLNASASRKAECGSRPVHHAVDRFGDELLVLDRLDVVALDRAEHLGERAQLLDRQRQRAASRCATAGEIQADSMTRCQHADQDQACLLEFAAHERSLSPFFNSSSTERVECPPRCRSSKYKPVLRCHRSPRPSQPPPRRELLARLASIRLRCCRRWTGSPRRGRRSAGCRSRASILILDPPLLTLQDKKIPFATNPGFYP